MNIDFAKLFGKYIRHLRRQSPHNQRIHAFSISGVFTVLITVGWLHFHYGLWSSEEGQLYPSSQKYEERELGGPSKQVPKNDELNSPKEVFGNFLLDLRSRVNAIPLNFSDVISDKETFERIDALAPNATP